MSNELARMGFDDVEIEAWELAIKWVEFSVFLNGDTSRLDPVKLNEFYYKNRGALLTVAREQLGIKAH